jgi:hypothetical protein
MFAILANSANAVVCINSELTKVLANFFSKKKVKIWGV